MNTLTPTIASSARRRRSPARRRSRGLSLVELVVTIAIVSFASIAIVGSLSAGAIYQQTIRERNGAMRVASEIMESTRRTLFSNLSREAFPDVVIDNRGTARTGDDVTGRAVLRFFDMAGNEVGTPGTPMPVDKSMVRVQVTVNWQPAGRTGADPREIELSSLLTP